MITAIADWTSMEAAPAMRVLGELSIAALDSVPLPILVVVFLALLASLRMPTSSSQSLLPSYSPSLVEKTRLSPTCHPTPIMSRPPPLFNPYFDLSTVPSSNGVFSASSPRPSVSFVGVVDSPNSLTGMISPRTRERSRRGRWCSERRHSSLTVVDEVSEEKAEV